MDNRYKTKHICLMVGCLGCETCLPETGIKYNVLLGVNSIGHIYANSLTYAKKKAKEQFGELVFVEIDL